MAGSSSNSILETGRRRDWCCHSNDDLNLDVSTYPSFLQLLCRSQQEYASNYLVWKRNFEVLRESKQ